MLLYYITNRRLLPGSDSDQTRALLTMIDEATAADIDYVELHETDHPASALESLAREALLRVRASHRSRLLIHSRLDVALAVGADGVHLTANDISTSDARATWAASLREGDSASNPRNFTVAVSCHSPSQVRAAESHGADFTLLSPIFGDSSSPPIGIPSLRSAALLDVPPDRRVEAGDHRVGVQVIAAGGITLVNAQDCLRAGAAGLAGTRLFQTGDLRRTVEQLRELSR